MQPISNPKVSLLYFTPNPEESIYVAARICYAALGANELQKNVNVEDAKKLIRFLVKAGHHSALEHASFTFSVENVSRVLTHQLVRNRIASYSHQSQRYVEMDENLKFIVPPNIKENTEFYSRFVEMVDGQITFYHDMVAAGIPKEDARYIIGGGVETKIVVTMNARELLNFFEHRVCHRAQWEIQSLARQMLELVLIEASTVFETAGPSCVREGCHEGKMSCGRPYSRTGGKEK